MEQLIFEFAAYYVNLFFAQSGHFPWLMKMFKGLFSYTEMGKAMDYISKVALDLIKARRQEEHTEKVYTNH